VRNEAIQGNSRHAYNGQMWTEGRCFGKKEMNAGEVSSAAAGVRVAAS
jgi:hypothetical protein